MSDYAIKVTGLGKQFKITSAGGGRFGYRSLRDTITDSVTWPARKVSQLINRSSRNTSSNTELFWALKDVSFEVRHGEVLGMIGRNGAGKSTLLKLLTRISEPSAGEIRLRGRVGSLLEVGTGFHPELTGRENVYLNGAILGMHRHEIDSKFDEIVDFAGVERFIETPVKRYSSGMYLRLAFAVAAHLEPEILLVDEVLAVGDAAFQKKCIGKMGDVARSGRTVLFVSHDMAAVESLCTRCILLNEGQLLYDADTPNVIAKHMSLVHQAARIPLNQRKDREGNGQIRFTGFWLLDHAGIQTDRAKTGASVSFCIEYEGEPNRPHHNISVGLSISDMWGHMLFRVSTEMTGSDFEVVPSSGVFRCQLPRMQLVRGEYIINIICWANGQVSDYLHDAARFEVEDGDFFGSGKLEQHGTFLVENHWSLKSNLLTVDDRQGQ